MFFSVTNTRDQRFPLSWKIDNFFVNTDAGWNHKKIDHYEVIYKGYLDQQDLEKELGDLVSQILPSHKGNFCAIVVDRSQQTFKILHDSLRSFPIWLHNCGIENLQDNGEKIWADCTLNISCDFQVERQWHKILGQTNDLPVLPRSQVIANIDNMFLEKFDRFLSHNTKPIKVFLSGGVDTTLVFSYLQKLTNNYELVLKEHVDFDWFWAKNHATIKKHWAYSQMHHWQEPCVLLSGAPGDEFSLRNPGMANMLLMTQRTDLLTVTDDPNFLHHDYFHLEKHVNLIRSQLSDSKIKDKTVDRNTLHYSLCDMAANDHQHWHLGNTMTWTPLRDLDILKQYLCLSFEDQLGQITNSEISQELIAKNNPDLLNLFSQQKNTENYLENLTRMVDHFGQPSTVVL